MVATGGIDGEPTLMSALPNHIQEGFAATQAMFFADTGRSFDKAMTPLKAIVSQVVEEHFRLQQFIRSHGLDPGFGPQGGKQEEGAGTEGQTNGQHDGTTGNGTTPSKPLKTTRGGKRSAKKT